MKASTAYAFAWLATATAVSVAIFVTGSLVPLWALFIPAFISVKWGD